MGSDFLLFIAKTSSQKEPFPLMKKFVILSLVILLAIFFIPWKVNLQNQNVLDEMYMRLRMRHPDRYTKADFQGFSGLRFPLWDPVTESVGDSWHVPLQY